LFKILYHYFLFIVEGIAK